MYNKLLTGLRVALFLVAGGFATTSWANTPPPPVNQNMGIPDGVFNNLVEQNCRHCHENEEIVNPGYLPDRHHLNVGKTIKDITAAPNGTPGGTYECLTCHELAWNDQTFSYEIVQNFRNCLNCHEQIPEQASVHHLTSNAQSLNCKACHGPINNPGDGHYIPTYQPSLVTPDTDLGTGPDGAGGCAFCHNAGTTDMPYGFVDAGFNVYSNPNTHHSTGIGQIGVSDLNCTVCHDFAAVAPIRKCEDCHGVSSIHNIQVDSDANGIQPGQELAYYGHIGNQSDCFGCHGFTAASASAPYAGPVFPDIHSVSAQSVTSGTATALTITGVALTNTILSPFGAIEAESKAVLTAADGSTVQIVPDAVTESSMDITIPATVAPGNYALRAAKGPSTSNSVNLAVLPQVTIDSASCTGGGTITIAGSGFGSYLNAADAGTSVSVDATGESCTIDSWNETTIVANCGAVAGTITVDSVFGSATVSVACN